MTVNDILAAISGKHIQPTWLNPEFEWRVQSPDKTIRNYGKPEGDPKTHPDDIDTCNIGTNFTDRAGRVHFIGIDIDGPSHKNGLSTEQVAATIEALKRLPYLHIYRSRSGTGYHAIAELAHEVRVTPSDDGEVYAVGRGFLQAVEQELGCEIPACTVGGPMYFGGPSADTGFELVKARESLYLYPVEPAYRSAKLIGKPVDLDPAHQSHIDWLEKNKKHDLRFPSSDGEPFKMHTTDLAAMHKALDLRGEFTTNSGGAGTDINGFMYPIEGGAWIVGRWNGGEDWATNENGTLYCILNAPPDPAEWLKTHGKTWKLDLVARFCTGMGADFAPLETENAATVRESENEIQFRVKVGAKYAVPAPWLRDGNIAVLTVIKKQTAERAPVNELRTAYAEDFKGLLYFQAVRPGQFHEIFRAQARDYLEGLGKSKREIGSTLSGNHFQIVNIPFGPELIGRQWNRDSIQLTTKPIDRAVTPADYKTWQSILNHIGAAFDEGVKRSQECRDAGITSGAHYVMLWDANVLRHPLRRLPLMGLYSPRQNTGKSTQFDKYQLILNRNGYFNAKHAIDSDGGFNAELENTLICDLDDVHLRDPKSRERLYSWITNPKSPIHSKGRTPYQVDNSWHFGHTANHLKYFYAPVGDTRCVFGEVQPLAEIIPKDDLQRALKAEAACYLRALMDLPLPPPVGRLTLPILDTDIKRQIMTQHIQLSEQQEKLVEQIKKLADKGKAESFEGKRVASDERALGNNWDTVSVYLTAAGYTVFRNERTNGRDKTTYTVSKV